MVCTRLFGYNYRMATKLLRLTSDDKREAKREGVFHNGEQLDTAHVQQYILDYTVHTV